MYNLVDKFKINAQISFKKNNSKSSIKNFKQGRSKPNTPFFILIFKLKCNFLSLCNL